MPSVGEPGYRPYCLNCTTMVRMHRNERKQAFVCRSCGTATRYVNGVDMFDRCAPRASECPASPWGRHQLDTTMESGPNNCFFCEGKMP